MEAVNVVDNSFNQMTLHTSSGCTMKGVKRKETGKVIGSSCVNTTDANAGCGVNAGTDTTFGDTFNSNGGGVLALELRSAGIRMWQFARDVVPSNVWSSPDPNSWGTATADFPNTECNIENHFRNQSIVANIDLCGDWAGAQKVYGENCELLLDSCLLFTDLFLCLISSWLSSRDKWLIYLSIRSWHLRRLRLQQQHCFQERLLGVRQLLCLFRILSGAANSFFDLVVILTLVRSMCILSSDLYGIIDTNLSMN